MAAGAISAIGGTTAPPWPALAGATAAGRSANAGYPALFTTMWIYSEQPLKMRTPPAVARRFSRSTTRLKQVAARDGARRANADG